MSEHTPANIWGGNGWHAAASDDGWGAIPKFCVGVNGVGHWPIAWVYREEDAALISAAPDLLATLKDALSFLGKYSEPKHPRAVLSIKCQAAIAKATGAA